MSMHNNWCRRFDHFAHWSFFFCCCLLSADAALDGEDSDATSLYYGRREQHSIALLGWPCRLTSLILNLENVQPTCTYWANLAAQTSLRSLELFNLDWAYCGGIIDLTACTQLTNLRVVHQDHDCPSLILKVRTSCCQQCRYLTPCQDKHPMQLSAGTMASSCRHHSLWTDGPVTFKRSP